jgi:alpha-N-arabinofuranosidase
MQFMEVAGQRIDYIAFHHMFNPDDPNKPALGNLQYRKDPDRTWEVLMNAVNIHEKQIRCTGFIVRAPEHPLSGEAMMIESPLPATIAKFLAGCR